MHRAFLTAALPLACLAAPAAAQEAIEPVDPDFAYEPSEAETESLDRMAVALSDPARQQALAETLAVLSEVLLDLPLAPIIEPLAEAAGEDPGGIDPDTTLRSIAPGADDVSEEIRENLPQAMDRLAKVSGGLAAMVPALRAMADRIEEALPPEMQSPGSREPRR